MKWWAVKGPDGEYLSAEKSESKAWAHALSGTSEPLFREWYKHDFPEDSLAACESLGYRCVEVNLVEPEQASALEQAFIQGAAWWEWHKEGATMWQSDRALALEEAERRTANGTLGQSPEVNTTTAGGGGEKGKP